MYVRPVSELIYMIDALIELKYRTKIWAIIKKADSLCKLVF